MTYQRGDRIVLVHTSDLHTRLIPGTAGTVTGYDTRLGQLAVAWDDGSTLAMLLHDGDHVRPLARPGLRPESVPSSGGCQPSRKERTVNVGEHAALPGGHQTGRRRIPLVRIRRVGGFDSFGDAGGRCSSASGAEANWLSWLHSLATRPVERVTFYSR